MSKVSLLDDAICNFSKHGALRVLKPSEGLADKRVTSAAPATRPPPGTPTPQPKQVSPLTTQTTTPPGVQIITGQRDFSTSAAARSCFLLAILHSWWSGSLAGDPGPLQMDSQERATLHADE